MKLIPARCPNCGADIEVNKDNQTTKCQYCNSRIIIDDAIAKYKIEVSGNVTIDNLPTAINLVKLGTRCLNQKEYKEAREKFEKAIEIDPDNSECIIKLTLSKIIMDDIEESSLDKLLISIKEAAKYCDGPDLDKYILYCLEKLEFEIKRIQLALNSNLRETAFYRLKEKYISYMIFCERLYANYTFNESTKIVLIKHILNNIALYKENGYYMKYSSKNDIPTKCSFIIPNNKAIMLNNKELRYKEKLAELDLDYRRQYQEEKAKKIEEEKRLNLEREKNEQKIHKLNECFMGKNIFTKIDAFICIPLFLLNILFLLIDLLTFNIFGIFSVIICILLCFPLSFIFHILKKENIIYQQNILSILALFILTNFRYLLVFFIPILTSDILVDISFKNETFIKDTTIIKFTDEKIIITENDDKQEYSYKYKKTSDDTSDVIITIEYPEGNKEYRYFAEEDKICLLKEEKCIEDYKAKTES